MSVDSSQSPRAGIKLGRRLNQVSEFGFSSASQNSEIEEVLTDFGEGHLMTVAPTGKGKGVSAIVPTLLEYPGSVIVFDPKGENLQMTRRRREELGQQVIVLNPFNVLTEETDSLNPLDLLLLEGGDVESDAQMLAQMLSAGNRGVKDPFWDLNACSIVSGLIAHYATCDDPAQRTLNQLHSQFHQNDVIYDLAVMLDTLGKGMNQFAAREIAAFLQHPERETRGGVQSTAVSYLKSLTGGRVPDVLGTSSFSLQDFVNGEQVSIYIIIPPGKLASHRGLLRILVATLLAAVMTREVQPEQPTLFLLDEAAQLGQFPLLEHAVTLCRGYGMKVWSFWQDLSQLKDCYPNSWSTIVNNCDIKQIFGISSMHMAREWSVLLEHEPQHLLKLTNDQQIVVMPDGVEHLTKKMNYRTDSEYQNLFDLNPRYGTIGRIRKRPEIPKRKPEAGKPNSDKKDEGNSGPSK